MERKLNLDISGSVASFDLLVKEVLPRNIFYRIIYGKGFDFDGYRDFSSDEDSSLIDWKASVRSEKLLVKKYVEERDLKVLFLIDIGENMVFGSSKKLKCEYAAELVAALAHLILFCGDRISFVLYNNKVAKKFDYGYGNEQFNLLKDELLNPLNYYGNSDLDSVSSELIDLIDKNNSLIFIVSDFIKLNDAHKRYINLLGRSFETVALVIRDPLDMTLPNLSKEIILEDPQTHERIFINPSVARKQYEENALKQLNIVKSIFNESEIDFRIFNTKESFIITLAEFLKERSERRIYKG